MKFVPPCSVGSAGSNETFVVQGCGSHFCRILETISLDFVLLLPEILVK